MDGWTYGRAESNMPLQLFQSWGHKNSISPQKQFSVPFNQFNHLLELRYIDLHCTKMNSNYQHSKI